MENESERCEVCTGNTISICSTHLRELLEEKIKSGELYLVDTHGRGIKVQGVYLNAEP